MYKISNTAKNAKKLDLSIIKIKSILLLKDII